VCRVQCTTRHITSHFGDDSFDAIDCTGTENQTTTKRKYTKHKKTYPNTDKLAVVKTQNHVSVHTIVDNCVTQYSTELFG